MQPAVIHDTIKKRQKGSESPWNREHKRRVRYKRGHPSQKVPGKIQRELNRRSTSEMWRRFFSRENARWDAYSICVEGIPAILISSLGWAGCHVWWPHRRCGKTGWAGTSVRHRCGPLESEKKPGFVWRVGVWTGNPHSPADELCGSGPGGARRCL